jgi:hypothetical protein
VQPLPLEIIRGEVSAVDQTVLDVVDVVALAAVAVDSAVSSVARVARPVRLEMTGQVSDLARCGRSLL